MQEEEVRKTEEKEEPAAIKSVRRRRRRLSPAQKKRWVRFFSAALVLLVAVFALTVVSALRHYRTYPGRVERDSISSPGRGDDYIILSWEATHSTDLYKVWYKENPQKKEKKKQSEEVPAEEGQSETENKERSEEVPTEEGQAETENKDRSEEVPAEEGQTETENKERSEEVPAEEGQSETENKEQSEEVPAEEGQSENKKEETVMDDSWTELETDVPEITVEDLKKGTSYAFVVRADSKSREGVATAPRNFSTKRPQKIKVSKKITKFTFSKPFSLNVSAETDLMYETADPDVAVVDPQTDKIKVTGAGTTEIKITARSSSEFERASKVVELEVIDATPVSAGGAAPAVIYHLDADNCEVVKTVTGEGGASVPQGLAYTGDKYIISYGMGNPNRIISFDTEGDGKDVSVPAISMGHPNGFTYASENALCYCAKGWTSKVFTYEPTSDSYGSVSLAYGCSGIGYDRKEKLLYTCSRTAMVAYDISDGYSVKYSCGVVKHSGTIYTQDCGGHAGIMYRCLSGSGKHGINYIDLYDMKNGRYLGTITCDLSEVESCIVDSDGFLEILANNSGGEDYIWKTELNADTLGEGL